VWITLAIVSLLSLLILFGLIQSANGQIDQYVILESRYDDSVSFTPGFIAVNDTILFIRLKGHKVEAYKVKRRGTVKGVMFWDLDHLLYHGVFAKHEDRAYLKVNVYGAGLFEEIYILKKNNE
jgi:hypothetical protein